MAIGGIFSGGGSPIRVQTPPPYRECARNSPPPPTWRRREARPRQRTLAPSLLGDIPTTSAVAKGIKRLRAISLLQSAQRRALSATDIGGRAHRVQHEGTVPLVGPLNRTSRNCYTRVVTLNVVKGLAVRFFAALLMNKFVVRTAHYCSVLARLDERARRSGILRMTGLGGRVGKCTDVMPFGLGKECGD
jgi:hypothetical protein